MKVLDNIGDPYGSLHMNDSRPSSEPQYHAAHSFRESASLNFRPASLPPVSKTNDVDDNRADAYGNSVKSSQELRRICASKADLSNRKQSPTSTECSTCTLSSGVPTLSDSHNVASSSSKHEQHRTQNNRNATFSRKCEVSQRGVLKSANCSEDEGEKSAAEETLREALLMLQSKRLESAYQQSNVISTADVQEAHMRWPVLPPPTLRTFPAEVGLNAQRLVEHLSMLQLNHSQESKFSVDIRSVCAKDSTVTPFTASATHSSKSFSERVDSVRNDDIQQPKLSKPCETLSSDATGLGASTITAACAAAPLQRANFPHASKKHAVSNSSPTRTRVKRDERVLLGWSEKELQNPFFDPVPVAIANLFVFCHCTVRTYFAFRCYIC